MVGAAREVMVGPGLYVREVSLEADSRPQRFPYRTHQFRVIATSHSPDSTSQVMHAIEQRLAAAKITVTGMTDLQAMQQRRDDHVVMIIAFLLTVAALSQLVGALGLATMLSVAVFERSQELGVMRAIGATRAQLMTLIISEGAFVALAGLLGAVLLAIPASYALNAAFGNMMLLMPLAMHPSVAALPALLMITTLVTLTAAGLPALRAANLEPRTLLTTT
jgi:ABC-type antimicrobial peptide transport system permease subunit